MNRYYIMYKTIVCGREAECLYKVVSGDRSLAEERLAAAKAERGDSSMWLHLETEEDYSDAWF